MRIISGKFKGKRLYLPNDKHTRPLKDIVKESIFNLILHSKKINLDIKDILILDLFSGSGSFGIECISREAKKVTFIENYSKAIKNLKRNLNSLKNTDNYQIIEKDFFEYFASYQETNPKFDLIFIDPPYKEKRINDIIKLILGKKILKINGIIIIHRHKKDSTQITNEFNILENRTYGLSKILFGN